MGSRFARRGEERAVAAEYKQKITFRGEFAARPSAFGVFERSSSLLIEERANLTVGEPLQK
ncbi:MAG: hypothetical protein NVS9B14_15310 [Candidatus Acidiferrum sp.]